MNSILKKMVLKISFSIIVFTMIALLAALPACGQPPQNDQSPSGYQSDGALIRTASGQTVYISDTGDSEGLEDFKRKIKRFYDFSQEFFPVWAHHIEGTSMLLEQFNSSDLAVEDKIEYAAVLEEKYIDFRDDLLELTPPPEASKAYGYAMDIVSKRILIFEGVKDGADVHRLAEMEAKSYMLEDLFWEEIDNIYDYFDNLALELGISDRKDLI